MEYSEERTLNQLGDKLREEYREVIVDFIVLDKKSNKVLVQKRSKVRKLFPTSGNSPVGYLNPTKP